MPTLQSLASVEDLAAFVGEPIEKDDKRALAVLGMVSSYVRAETGTQWGDGDHADVPDAIRDVVVDVAARVWFNPEGLVGDDIDDSSRRWSDTAAEGMYLTAANRSMLRAYMSSSRASGGLRTVSTTRGEGRADDTIYVPTGPPPSGYPFPWYAEFP